MKLTPDDPRLTAYALGELDAATRKAIETELANSPELQREVEAISQTATTLSTELAAEPLPELTYAQQLAIEAELKSAPAKPESAPHHSTAAKPSSALAHWSAWLRRSLIFATATAVLIVISLVALHFLTGGPGAEAFAQTLNQIQKAKIITWKETIYFNYFDKDGKNLGTRFDTREYAYKEPGLYHITTRDGLGNILGVEIVDAMHQQKLTINPTKKTTTLSFTRDYGTQNPFAEVKYHLEANNLQWIEKRTTATGEANVFRHTLLDMNLHKYSRDIWIDEKTRQLVQFHAPGSDFFQPDEDPALHPPPPELWRLNKPAGWHKMTIAGTVQYDIAFDADLDDSLFRLEPPAGYTTQKDQASPQPHVTEKEMIDYLRIATDYNNQTFPDQVFPYIFTSDRLNKIWDKPQSDRTPAEQKLLDADNHYKMAGLYELPIGEFVHASTEPKTFRYLGNGVKLGDKDRIVCWYKLKGATTYRALYGDLSIKDVTVESLPLPVNE